MLDPFGPEIWTARGGEVSVFGFRYPTRMAAMRLSDGGLFIWSPIALSPALRSEIEALGPVRALVAPNSLHHLFLPEWQAAFPDARTYAAPGLRRRRPEIAVDEELTDRPPAVWDGEIKQSLIRGNAITTEAVFFHARSRTALFADLLQQFPPAWFTGWRRLVARLDLMIAPEPTTPRKFRIAFTDRRAARASLAPVLAWPTERVLIAHGAPVERNGQAVLDRAFRWLG